jgi:uncharacterized protein with HEPN domain
MQNEIIQDRLQLILEHGFVKQERVIATKDENSFLQSKAGLLIIDSLVTRLQALSENIKKIQKVDPLFFEKELPLNVNPIIRFRDLISHHYEKLDPAMLLHICKSEVPLVIKAVRSYLGNLNN